MIKNHYCWIPHTAQDSRVTSTKTRMVSSEPRHEKTCPGFATSYRPDKLQRLVGVLKFLIQQVLVVHIGIILSRQRTTKTLIRLRECAGWSAAFLFAYGINRCALIIPILRGCLQSLFNIPVPWYLFDTVLKVISWPAFVSRCIIDAYFSFYGLVLDIVFHISVSIIH